MIVSPRLGIPFVALVLVTGCGPSDLVLPGSGIPAAVRIVSGDGQQAETGTVLEQPLTVEVLDDGSRPVADARVEFGFLGDMPGGAIEPSSASTDELGRASAVVQVGNDPGDQLVEAQVANAAELRARFVVTVLGKGGDDGGKKGKGRDKEDDD